MRIAVVGGGISGLAAADELARRLPGSDVVVFEGSPAVGGKLRVEQVAGTAVDVGAEALLARRPEALALIESAGLDDEVISPLTTSAWLRVGGANHPLPARTMLGIPSDAEAVRASGAVTDAALARIVAEPAQPQLPPLTGDVAVGALVRERLGNEVTDRLVEPLLGGVYAGRADELSLRATMPALAEVLTREGGSLVAAAAKVTDVAGRSPSSQPVFASLAGGVGRLPATLAASGRFLVRTSTTVRRIDRTPSGFRLVCGAVPLPHEFEADAVVVATPAAKAAQLLRDVAPAAATELATIETASMAVVTLAFAEAQLPAGSGVLVGVREHLATKALTFSSQKWPMPTGGIVLLRGSLGRIGETQILQRDDADLVAIVRSDLRAITGVDAQPIDTRVTRWGGGLPQYSVGHVDRVARIRAAVDAVPRLAVCGATYDGVGVPACIASARRAADRIVQAFAAAGSPGGTMGR